MIVVSRPIHATVALIEKGEDRVLVLQDGLLPRAVVALLGQLLSRV